MREEQRDALHVARRIGRRHAERLLLLLELGGDIEPITERKERIDRALSEEARLRGLSLKRDVLFAVFGGEEQGLFGSAACAERVNETRAMALKRKVMGVMRFRIPTSADWLAPPDIGGRRPLGG